MQIISNEYDLREMWNPVSWENIKENIINLSSAELTQRMIKRDYLTFSL